MARKQFITTNATFIDGRYVPKGFPVMVDTDKLSGKERNFADPGDRPVGGVVEMSAIAPTGPNPKTPQQVPHDAVQTVEGHVIPGGVKLVGETASTPSQTDFVGGGAEPSAAAAAALEDDPGDHNFAELKDEAPALDGTKAELIAIAEAEGVEFETDDNKADIVAKIEAKRRG